MQFSGKLKKFSDFFSEFLKSTSNCEYCLEKDGPHSLFISQTIECKKRCYLNG